MATIYDYETGSYIAEGLQGCFACDEAIQAAIAIARDGGEPVILDDDDGSWVVHPDGSFEEFVWPDPDD